MANVGFTIWALILRGMGISVFRTCFSDSMEDEYGDNLLSGPPITSFLFILGVYTIVTNLNIYPSSFRKLITPIMGLYEFLAMAFILDFSVACIWTPIDVHIYTTLTKVVYKTLESIGFNEAATWMLNNKFPRAIICCAIAISFFLITLHVTRSVDFSIYTEHGPKFFYSHVKNKMVQKIASELPHFDETSCIECQKQKTSRRRRRHRKVPNT